MSDRMKVHAAVADPDSTKVRITLEMSVSDWKQMIEQFDRRSDYMWPAIELITRVHKVTTLLSDRVHSLEKESDHD